MVSRKYRQRGYLDEDRPERQRGGAPAPRREGPRGRGLGSPKAAVFRCSRCGGKRPAADEIEADAVCAACGSDLHTCTNCLHFDTSAPLECRQPIPERIVAKAKRNDCELFAPKIVSEQETGSGSPDDPRAAFDSLFDF